MQRKNSCLVFNSYIQTSRRPKCRLGIKPPHPWLDAVALFISLKPLCIYKLSFCSYRTRAQALTRWVAYFYTPDSVGKILAVYRPLWAAVCICACNWLWRLPFRILHIKNIGHITNEKTFMMCPTYILLMNCNLWLHELMLAHNDLKACAFMNWIARILMP